MQFEELPSGIVLPAKPPKQPQPAKYGPHEVQNEEDREKVKKALSQLWDALQLSRTGAQIRLPGDDNRKLHRKAYSFIGDLLLGDEYPVKEELC